jgi:hypothetical protein
MHMMVIGGLYLKHLICEVIQCRRHLDLRSARCLGTKCMVDSFLGWKYLDQIDENICFLFGPGK